MINHGLEPDFPPAALRQLDTIDGPATTSGNDIHDLRALDWASIDNDDSRDLDQLSVAESLDNGDVRILIAVADVDSLVTRNSPLDLHAQVNTTSVYTPCCIFPMLPEKLSTNLTSLNADQDRLAVVVSYVVHPDGSLGDQAIYRAQVRNKAKLAYRSVSAWLEGEADMPDAMKAASGVPDQIKLQDEVALRLRKLRHEHGALTLETIEPEAIVENGEVVDLRVDNRTRAHLLIEDFMIAANGVAARYLASNGLPSLRRMVRKPERWDKIRDVANQYGESLPHEPDAPALQHFLDRRQKADPLRFPDLSLTIIKLLGPGEYVVLAPGQTPVGHFGLAVREYTHSTAPNRRYPDDITQRMIKASLDGARPPYEIEELESLAEHCTLQEDAAKKVERQVRKSAAALILSHRIGEQFDAIVTGASEKGTWVRALGTPVEGRVVHGFDGMDVGDRVRVKLIDVNVERGFIDFAGLQSGRRHP
jgi:exoribonuclease-2